MDALFRAVQLYGSGEFGALPGSAAAIIPVLQHRKGNIVWTTGSVTWQVKEKIKEYNPTEIILVVNTTNLMTYDHKIDEDFDASPPLLRFEHTNPPLYGLLDVAPKVRMFDALGYGPKPRVYFAELMLALKGFYHPLAQLYSPALTVQFDNYPVQHSKGAIAELCDKLLGVGDAKEVEGIRTRVNEFLEALEEGFEREIATIQDYKETMITALKKLNPNLSLEERKNFLEWNYHAEDMDLHFLWDTTLLLKYKEKIEKDKKQLEKKLVNGHDEADEIKLGEAHEHIKLFTRFAQTFIKAFSAGYSMGGSVIDLYQAVHLLFDHDPKFDDEEKQDTIYSELTLLQPYAIKKELNMKALVDRIQALTSFVKGEETSLQERDKQNMEKRMPSVIINDSEIDDIGVVLLVAALRKKLKISTPLHVVHQFDSKESINKSKSYKEDGSNKITKLHKDDVKNTLRSAFDHVQTFAKKNSEALQQENITLSAFMDDTIQENKTQHSALTAHTWNQILREK